MTNPAFLTLLIDAIARTIPADADQGAAAREAGLTMARTLLEAWQPADAMEAALAARAIAGHLAAMDSFARAAKPGVSDEKAIRLRANAFAAGRIFDRQFQALRRQRQPAPDRTPAANVRGRRRAGAPPGRSATAGSRRVRCSDADNAAGFLVRQHRARSCSADGPRPGLTRPTLRTTRIGIIRAAALRSAHGKAAWRHIITQLIITSPYGGLFPRCTISSAT